MVSYYLSGDEENQKADVRAQDMKTTLVIPHVREDSFRRGHIGDSRLYFFRDQNLSRQTLDRMEKIVRKNGRGKNMDNYSAITVWLK